MLLNITLSTNFHSKIQNLVKLKNFNLVFENISKLTFLEKNNHEIGLELLLFLLTSCKNLMNYGRVENLWRRIECELKDLSFHSSSPFGFFVEKNDRLILFGICTFIVVESETSQKKKKKIVVDSSLSNSKCVVLDNFRLNNQIQMENCESKKEKKINQHENHTGEQM